MTEIKNERPPNFNAIAEVFPGARGEGVIFAYAPFIYAPSHKGLTLPRELVAHENIHIERQLAIGVEKWWGIYLTNPVFVFVEELLAHRAEYRYVMRNGSRSERRRADSVIPQKLSATLYGSLVTASKAYDLIVAEHVDACPACGGLGLIFMEADQCAPCENCRAAGYIVGAA